MPSAGSSHRHAMPAAWQHLVNRRDLLRVASLGMASTFLPCTLPTSAIAAVGEGAVVSNRSARSVILLWMAGGVTHIDSFDPKPDAPAEIRGTLKDIATDIPGIRFCETLPCLARQVNHLAVLRSYSHGSDDHFLSQAHALSGQKVGMQDLTTEPNVGAVVSRVQGPRNSFPGYIAIPGTTRPGPPPKNLFTGGWLGQEYAPFSTGGAPRNEDFTAKVLEPPEEELNLQALSLAVGTDPDRIRRRRSLRELLDDSARDIDSGRSNRAVDRQFSGAFDMLLSPGVRRAFELAREPDPLRDTYGRTKIGSRCLLARRLVEAGAPFVMVDYGYDPEFGNLWDNHCAPGQNQPPIYEMVKLPYHVAGIDRAFAGLIADLADRGMLDDTLVVFLTEFGRTPKINAAGGRDHWGAAGSIFFAGGGTKGGQVIGATDKNAAHPTTMRYHPGDVAATIYQAVGIDHQMHLHDRQNRPVHILPDGNPIPGVLA
jgi:hypothetical protein